MAPPQLSSCGPRQWGRDRMAAEGGYQRAWINTCTSVNGAATGWPRKVDEPLELVGRHVEASMGPRPDGRGRGLDEGLPFRTKARQWGRDRMAAEGPYL